MSHSILSLPLSRAILRRSLSRSFLTRFNSALVPRDPTPEKQIGALEYKLESKNHAIRIPRTWGNVYRTTKISSNPAAKRRVISPKDLLTLLQKLGYAMDIREDVKGKSDLSFTHPVDPVRNSRGYTWWRLNWLDEISLKGITQLFIYNFYYLPPEGSVTPDLENLDLLKKVFREDVVNYLASKGYRPEDVLVWAWILMAKDGDEAGLRMDVWSKVGVKMEVSLPEQKLGDVEPSEERGVDGYSITTGVSSWIESIKGIFQSDVAESLSPEDHSSTEHLKSPPQPITRTPRIPPFILLFNLRRPTHNLSASTLSLLLPHIRQTLSSPLPSQSRDDKTPLLILIRLLRHARSSWPAVIPMCAELITTYIHPTTSPPAPSIGLTKTYNRLLSLFSFPTSSHPFKIMPLQQDSQFTILRKMAALDIPITREGYRALITIQLAHRKTPTEILHANSLSTNWPPWPVPKDGHHRSPGHSSHDKHLSRAAQMLKQMTEAGYSNLGWEQEALVLAGADTDSSPTIQTRTFYHHTRNSTTEVPVNIWAVRVRATRTLEEAWSIFLDYINTAEISYCEVWEEMFSKIISARKEQRLRESRERKIEVIKAAYEASSSPSGAPTQVVVQALDRWDLIQRALEERKKRVLPGDAKEVGLPPVSPSEGVYVGIPPPGVEELFLMMKRMCGKVYKSSKRLVAMLVRESGSVEEGEFLLKEWSKEQFRRLIKSASTGEIIEGPFDKGRKYRRYEAFLDRSLLTSYLHLLLSTSTAPPNKHTPSSTSRIHRTDLAIRLLIGQAPRYPPAWGTVLSALTTSLTSDRLNKDEKKKHALAVWQLFRALKTFSVPVDAEILRLLCVAAERTLSLGDDVLWDGLEPAERVVDLFAEIFYPPPEAEVEIQTPPLLLPEMAMLHSYVRLLGFTGRHGEIVRLVKWMRGCGNLNMGCVMGKRVLVACRVFLRDQEEAYREVQELVEEWLGAEGWPGEVDVEEYCIRGWRGGVWSRTFEDSSGQ